LHIAFFQVDFSKNAKKSTWKNMFLKKMYLFVLFFLFSYTSPAMEISRNITRQYRNENTQGYRVREFDSCLHKLNIKNKKRKRRKPKKLYSQKVACLLYSILPDSEIIEQNFPESILQILEDFPIYTKQENEDSKIIERIQEREERYRLKKKMGYKMYVAKFTMKNGTLVLIQDFPQ